MGFLDRASAGPGKSPPGGRALQARPVARPITNAMEIFLAALHNMNFG